MSLFNEAVMDRITAQKIQKE